MKLGVEYPKRENMYETVEALPPVRHDILYSGKKLGENHGMRHLKHWTSLTFTEKKNKSN